MMMSQRTSNHSHRAENALKRSDELIAVGQRNAALQVLHDVVMNCKRQSRTPLTTLEPLLHRYVELCVELRKGRIAKEGLHQFKNLAQGVNVSSLDVVIKYFVDLAEQKVNDAQKKATQLIADVEDLEAVETPEGVMMNTVSAEDSKDRTDRAVVMPWFRFLWETYRIVLDILKLNSRLESMYQAAAQQAFQFCLKYKRKTEFRRLNDILRNHLSLIGKAQKLNQINLNAPESLQMHLETRFAQLNAATELELWQEAFRSIEDIHGLMTMSKKQPKPQTMAGYYEKLSQVFLVADNFLFHAAAYLRFYSIIRACKRDLTPEQHEWISSIALLAVLSVPISGGGRNTRVEGGVMSSGYFDFDEQTEKNRRLAALMNAPKAPTREMLLRELLSKNIVQYAAAPLRSLYGLLEVDFHPLTICSKLEPIFNFLKQADSRLMRYIRPLQYIMLSRLLQQLSRVYKTMRIESITQLATFVTPYEIEKFILESSKRHELPPMSINHQSRSITFQTEFFNVGDDDVKGASSLATIDTMNVAMEVSSITPSALAGQLSMVARRLHRVYLLTHPEVIEEKMREKRASFDRLLESLAEEHRHILSRKTIIERNKEIMERLIAQKQREDARERAIQLQRQQELERQRIEEESKRRELERIRRDHEEIRRQEALKLAENMKKKSDAGGLKLELNELKELDTQQLMAKQAEQLEQEKRELQARLKSMAKRLDYIERAYRKEEISFLKQDLERQKVDHRVYFEKEQQHALELSRSLFEEELSNKERMLRMLPDCEHFKQDVERCREAEFERIRLDAMVKMREEKTMLRRERLRRKAEEHKRRIIEERHRRQREKKERQRQKEEEIRRKLHEEGVAQRKAEELEHRRKMDQLAETQRIRDAEIEERKKASQGLERGSGTVLNPKRAVNTENGLSWRVAPTTQSSTLTPNELPSTPELAPTTNACEGTRPATYRLPHLRTSSSKLVEPSVSSTTTRSTSTSNEDSSTWNVRRRHE